MRAMLWETPFEMENPLTQVFAETTGSERQNASVPVVAKAKEWKGRTAYDRLVATANPTGKRRNRDLTLALGSASTQLSFIPRTIAENSDGRPVLMPASQPITARQINASGKNNTQRLLASNRWATNAWLFLRDGSSAASSQGGQTVGYGASQAGIVLSYRLSPNGRLPLRAYTRVTKALAGSKEADAALGLSLQPVPNLPVIVHAEARVTRVTNRTLVRPQAFVTAQLPSTELPLGLQANAYGQAGYVGGEFATAFADGQAKVDGVVGATPLGRIRAGAGMWGGVQQNAGRLDVGPSLSLSTELADKPITLSLDYRYRIAGNAEPGSGVALTVSTGF